MEAIKSTIPKIETRPGNTRVKGRRSAPKAENRMVTKLTGEHLAYQFKEPQVGELDVLATFNGWWGGDSGKVKLQKLIDAYKIDANDDEACFYAGISAEQLKYFQELHPGFYTIKHRCKQNLGLLAKKKFAVQVESGEAALTYLRLKRKDEGYNPRVEMTGANGRDLYEGLAQEIRTLGETLRGDVNDDEFYDENSKEHAGELDAGNTDAGAVGAGHEATPAEDPNKGPAIPPQSSETV